MVYNIIHIISRSIVLLVLISSVIARPQHFGDASQAVSADQDPNINMIGAPTLTDLQIELLAQRLAEFNNQIPDSWDRLRGAPLNRLRGAPMKRQSRFRQCYFNPVSCFKK